MPLLPPAASDYTELLKSLASIPSVNTTPNVKWNSRNVPLTFLGKSRSLITQSRIAESSFTQPLNYRTTDNTQSNVTPSITYPPVTANLKLWVDATVQDYMTFGSNRTLGNQTYQIVTGLSNIYGVNGTTVTNADINPPVFTYVDTAFLSNAGLPAGVQATNNPAFYFRGRDKFGDVDTKYDTMTWNLGLAGKPVVLFGVVQGFANGSIFGSSYGYFHTFASNYAYAGIPGTQTISNISVTYRYASNAKPILYTFGNDLSGGVKYHYLRFNGNPITSRTSRTDVADGGVHNMDLMQIGRYDPPQSTSCIIHEVLLYDAVLSSNDITTIETYLINKWNLS